MYSIFQHRKTYIYLLLSIISMLAALIVSIPDNPPGIVLSFISSILLVIAFTHNFTSIKSYVILSVISVAGFAAAAVLHNFLEAGGKGTFIELISVFFFLVAIFICPAGFVVGIIGIVRKAFGKKEGQGVVCRLLFVVCCNHHTVHGNHNSFPLYPIFFRST